MSKTDAPKLPFVLVQDGLRQVFFLDGQMLSREDVERVVGLAEQRCAQISCEDKNKHGTGIRVGAGKVLTCWHIKGINGQTLKVDAKTAIVLHESRKDDLMLLQTEPDNLPEIILSGKIARLDPVFWVGNPLQERCLVTQCQVLGARPRRFFISHQVQVGSSGSGVYDYSGRLAGIIYKDEGRPKLGTISCARPVSLIQKFLEEEPNLFRLTG